MSNVATFKTAHSEILGIVGEIVKYLDSEEKVSAGAADIRSYLSQIAGKLSVHLAMEDKFLYPKLMESEDPTISGTAKKFADEMSGVADVFKEYSNKWQAKAIGDSPAEFITATNGLFAAVGNRIEREEKELYVLLD